jgi:hypothetical protein
VIVIDALYRAMPENSEENSNDGLAKVYNHLVSHASRLGCGIICVHHTSKGAQGGKAVTDVGSGAGAQSRAADAHMVVRQHEEKDVFVVDAELRSFPQIESFCLRKRFPTFDVDDTADPARSLRAGGRRKPNAGAPAKPPKRAWDV